MTGNEKIIYEKNDICFKIKKNTIASGEVKMELVIGGTVDNRHMFGYVGLAPDDHYHILINKRTWRFTVIFDAYKVKIQLDKIFVDIVKKIKFVGKEIQK